MKIFRIYVKCTHSDHRALHIRTLTIALCWYFTAYDKTFMLRGLNSFSGELTLSIEQMAENLPGRGYKTFPASILYKSIAGRYRPVRVADGPITAHYRFMYNAYWCFSCSTQQSIKLSLLKNMKMPTIVIIFIFISRENFMIRHVLQEKNC